MHFFVLYFFAGNGACPVIFGGDGVIAVACRHEIFFRHADAFMNDVGAGNCNFVFKNEVIFFGLKNQFFDANFPSRMHSSSKKSSFGLVFKSADSKNHGLMWGTKRVWLTFQCQTSSMERGRRKLDLLIILNPTTKTPLIDRQRRFQKIPKSRSSREIEGYEKQKRV